MARKTSGTSVAALGKYSLLVLLFALFLAGFYMTANVRNNASQIDKSMQAGSVGKSALDVETYTNTVFGFYFKFPATYTLECPECEDETDIDSASHISLAPPNEGDAAILVDVF